MTLYEMTEATRELYEMLNNDEIDEQTVSDTLEGMAVGEKLEGYCQVIRQFEADTAAFKAEKDFFAMKQKRAENAIERLERAVELYMTAAGKEKEKCGLFEIKITKSKAVQILDEKAIPKVFLVEQPPKVDKANIRKALLAGEEVQGAELQENRNIKIK